MSTTENLIKKNFVSTTTTKTLTGVLCQSLHLLLLLICQINIKNNIPNRHWLSHNSYNCPNISNISLNSSTHPPILTPTPLSTPSIPLLKKSLIPMLPFSQLPPPPSFYIFTKINAATLNVASLTNKADHLLDVFNDLDLDIICLTETWLLDSDRAVISQLTSDSITFIQLNRPGPHRGGGISP